MIAHTGHTDAPTAHARMAIDGLDRGAELAGVEVPDAGHRGARGPGLPAAEPRHARAPLGAGRLVRIPGMGHAISRTVIPPLAAAILTQTRNAPADQRAR